jgi:outer membrane protein TolC
LGELKPDSLEVSFNVLLDRMLTDNPMLEMLKYEQQSLDARSKMVKRMGYPMVGVGLDYSIINKSDMSTSPMNGKDMIMPMVKFTLPVYRKKYKAMQTETSLLKSASEQGYISVSNNLQTEFYEARQLFDDAGRKIKLYENQAKLARQSLDIMIKTFSVSGAGLTDVLQVRQQILDYEIKRIEAISDYNTAIAWLEKLMATS